MSDSENIAVMQRELGRQLAALAGFSRSTVSVAEIGRLAHAREFWEACDKALDTDGVLSAGIDQVDVVRGAEQRAAARAAQEAREARALAALSAAQQHGGVTTEVTAVQSCPHCGQDVTVLTTLIAETIAPAPPQHSA